MKLSMARHLLTIQAPSQIRDEGGGFVESWQDIEDNPDVWCAIKTTTPNIETGAAQQQSVLTHIISTRYRPDIKTRYRLLDKSSNRSFLIDTLKNINEANKVLDIYVREFIED